MEVALTLETSKVTSISFQFQPRILASTPKNPNGTCYYPEIANTLIRINDREYEVISQLTLPSRGRWKVRDPRPRPNGTIYTVVDREDTPTARQLKDSLLKLKQSAYGIPRLVDFEQVDGRLRMVITWVDGTDLQAYLDKLDDNQWKPLSVWEAVRRIKSLAHLVMVLHNHCQVIHGDIKPSNLILPGDRNPIAVIDYGSSWQISRTRDRLEGDGCDVYYSAPEVLDQSTIVDERADHFSIASVLFRMIFGETPFDGLGGQAGLSPYRKRYEKGPELPIENSIDFQNLTDSTRREIKEFFDRALNLNPNDRFPSSRSFASAIDGIYLRLKSDASPSKIASQKSGFRKWLTSFFRDF